jgi:hemerythrin
MTLLLWKDAYLTGIPELDAEHKDLVVRVNERYQKDAGGGREGMIRFLDILYGLLEVHFASEEAYMGVLKQRDYRAHVDAHREILESLEALIARLRKDPGFNAGTAVAERLDAWFGRHFLSHDVKLHRVLA